MKEMGDPYIDPKNVVILDISTPTLRPNFWLTDIFRRTREHEEAQELGKSFVKDELFQPPEVSWLEGQVFGLPLEGR